MEEINQIRLEFLFISCSEIGGFLLQKCYLSIVEVAPKVSPILTFLPFFNKKNNTQITIQTKAIRNVSIQNAKQR